jgi:SOS response regulatory protein OraA/RecX
LKGLDKETLNRRLYAYLARRGFRGPEISNAIKAALEESADNVTRVTFR